MKEPSFSRLIRNEIFIPLVFLLAGSMLMVYLWTFNKRIDQDRLALETRITAEQIQLRLESCIDSRASLVKTLSEQNWQNQSQLLTQWYGLAFSLYPLFSGIQALNYIDGNRVIRVVYPMENNANALNFDLYNHPAASVLLAIERADQMQEISRTDILELVQSGSGFVLYQPILSPEGRKLGFVNGVFRLDDLMSSCLEEETLRDRFVFRLYETNGEMFYQQPTSFSGELHPEFVTLDVQIVDRPWKMEFSPAPAYVVENASLIDQIWPALGFVLACLLSWTLHKLIRKQNSLRKSEDNYRMLVENQNDMLVKVNMAYEFLYVSPSYCKAFGVSENDLLGGNFLPFIHVDDRELTLKSLQRIQQPPYSSYHEQRAKTANGWRWLAWSNTGVLDKNGKVIEITAVGRDVTEIKDLEARVSRSQKMQAIGEMAGGITHDFNNLLQVMSGNVEFLLEQMPSEDDKREQVSKVSEMIERAMSLTNQLATLSRQQPTKNEIIDLNAYILEMLDLLKRTLPGSISILMNSTPGTLNIFADKSQLEQVLLNICFNARDAIETTGSICISTKISNLDETFLEHSSDIQPGKYAVIVIEDDGCGIASDILPRVFDPFFTTKGANAGSGLGLANSYSIIRKYDGTIMVDSEPGKGSRFSIYLPLSLESHNETSPKSTTQLIDKPNNGLVLVADDNHDVLNLIVQILNHAGHQTLTANDGEEALRLYRENSDKISLTILDLVMPNMGGFEAAEELKKAFPDIKILFVSGFIPEEESSFQKDDATILIKPFKGSQLIKKVRELLDL